MFVQLMLGNKESLGELKMVEQIQCILVNLLRFLFTPASLNRNKFSLAKYVVFQSRRKNAPYQF